MIPRLPTIYDEPFADSSQIPTYLICHAARQHVTVALSGDGGDELFGGYNRYTWTPRIWNRVSWLPYTTRKSLGLAITTLPLQTLNIIGIVVKSFFSNKEYIVHLGNRLHKVGYGLKRVRFLEVFIIYLATEWQNPEALIKNLVDFSSRTKQNLQVNQIEKNLGLNEATTRMMYRGSLTYLPDDILTKVDRASMAVSLEVRVPLLDHRLVEYAWKLPLSVKIRNGKSKWILRKILYKYGKDLQKYGKPFIWGDLDLASAVDSYVTCY